MVANKLLSFKANQAEECCDQLVKLMRDNHAIRVLLISPSVNLVEPILDKMVVILGYDGVPTEVLKGWNMQIYTHKSNNLQSVPLTDKLHGMQYTHIVAYDVDKLDADVIQTILVK